MLKYLIYILAFVIGSIGGLLISYKKHGEPYIVQNVDIPTVIMAIIGWILVVNLRWNIISAAVGFFLVGFVLSERPGYGRKETVIGIVVSLIAYLIIHFMFVI